MSQFAADTLATLPPSFFDRPASEVARALLGRYLVRELEGERLVLRVVETEAYLGMEDRASHAWAGRRTPRNESLYLPPGHAYVYFIYGMHFCLNVTTGPVGAGGAVLFRAGEPLLGEETMARLRGLVGRPKPGAVAGGPGKLARALGVDRALDGSRLACGELWLAEGSEVPAEQLVVGPRVGIDYAGEAVGWPLRFAERANRHVSRPRL
ncbi:MAG TPA: DNA-3-methyladenine glycosylase [Thermoanaerobaculia bacterium]|nr:DNA-3-methyladenine glycosylase [Thermoanaerobaculia bacterium]